MKTSLLALTFLFSSALFAVENPTILYIGDSHSYGKLGTVIDKNLSTISNRVILESSCGSTPVTWLGTSKYAKTVCGFWKKDGANEVRSVKEHETPKLADELATYRPDITVVQLGTNMAVGNPKSFTTSITTVMNTIKNENSVCIWVGPPDANSKVVTRDRLKETNQLLINLAKANNCFYIDSLVMTSFPKDVKEGIHYPPSLSAAWGEKVSVELLKIIAGLNQSVVPETDKAPE